MKAVILFATFLIVTTLTFLTLLGHHLAESYEPANPTEEVEGAINSPLESVDRPSVVFLFGAENGNNNRYFSIVARYYAQRKSSDTIAVVKNCRSLLQVRDYLAENAIDGFPWGEIHLVIHSNEWSGTGFSVVADGPRVTYTSLLSAMESEIIAPLPNEVLDEETVMNVHACALGKNWKLMYLISKALGGEDYHRPVVNSSACLTVSAGESKVTGQV